MHDLLSPDLLALREEAAAIAADVLVADADAVDAEGRWPGRGLRALLDVGLGGLTAPRRLGGHGQGLLGLTAVTEVLGRACASTSMCFGMHGVATAVIAAKSTPAQDEAFLVRIARGRHLTTLALSESGSGAHFFLPATRLAREDDGYRVDGAKQFVTNGDQADSYVVSTIASEPAQAGDFSCLVVERDAPGIAWGTAWSGLGMRGNASRPMTLDGVHVPHAALLGEEGDQVWYMFEVVAPFFLTAIAGTYLGVAQAALDLALAHLRDRVHAHSGRALAEVEVLQHRVGQLWITVERCRALVYRMATLGDLGRQDALAGILACKVDAANTAVFVTNEAMTLCGGMAYRENGPLARLLRDARASHVMSPGTDMLTTWTGRSVLGVPLL